MGKYIHAFFDNFMVPIIMLLGAPIFALCALMDTYSNDKGFVKNYKEISNWGLDKDA